MAHGEKNVGWSGFFMVFTVFAAILMILAQQGQGMVASGGGSWQVLSVYEGLTRWAVPALFMVWGMMALESGKPNFTGALMGLALPCFCLLVFWGRCTPSQLTCWGRHGYPGRRMERSGVGG